MDAATEGRVVWGIVWRQVAVADEVVNDDHGGVLFEGVAVAHQAGDFVKRQAEEFVHFAVAVVRTEVGRQFQIVVVEGVGADAVFGLRGVADDADRTRLSRQRFRNGRFFVAFFDEVGKDAAQSTYAVRRRAWWCHLHARRNRRRR